MRARVTGSSGYDASALIASVHGARGLGVDLLPPAVKSTMNPEIDLATKAREQMSVDGTPEYPST